VRLCFEDVDQANVQTAVVADVSEETTQKWRPEDGIGIVDFNIGATLRPMTKSGGKAYSRRATVQGFPRAGCARIPR
jgi:hypothetical protein